MHGRSDAFDQWVVRKDLLERGQNILESLVGMEQLEENDEGGRRFMKDITKAVVAIECAIAQITGNSMRIRPFFFKWLKQNCAYSNVVIDDEVYQKISEEGKLFISEVSDGMQIRT